jgi:hypothetical protein
VKAPLKQRTLFSGKLYASRQVSHPGFALIIAISLMAFLMLLLVSMTALTNIETQVANISLQTTQARKNALVGMSIALGELQKYAGPDQRTTAAADLQYGEAVANPRWVGVYGNSVVAGYDIRPSNQAENEPVLLNWLVSGNAGQDFTASTSAADFGRITNAPGNLPYKPDAAVNVSGGSLSSATATSDITIDGSEARLLVGPGSSGAANPVTDFVVAPLVDIEGDGTNGVAGGYAYWIGDEGAKAKFNRQPGYLDAANGAEQILFQQYSFVTAQRSALEVVDAETGSLIGDDFDYTVAALPDVAELSQLALLGTTGAFKAASQNRFHDLTTCSYGVLADSYAGGLKKDLTADFAGANDIPDDDLPVFTRESDSDTVPTWGQLRSFAMRTGTGAIDPVLPTDTRNGLSPVITMACFGLDVFLDAGNQLHVAMFPLVILWNPYDVELNDHTYELGFHMQDNGSYELQVERNGTTTTLDTLDLSAAKWSSEAGMAGAFVRFKLQSGVLAPGESIIYTLTSSGNVYAAGMNTMGPVDSGMTSITNYVSWTTPNLVLSSAPNPGDTVNLAGDKPKTRGQRMDVVLAEEGQLSNLSNTDGWYQAVLDARPGCLGPAPANRVKLLGSSGYDLTTINIDSSGAASTLRIQMPMEARGWNSDKSVLGSFAGGGTRWLITGDPRAPIIRNTDIENNYDVNAHGNVLFGAVLQLLDYNTGRDRFFPLAGYTWGARAGAGRGQQTTESTYAPSVLFDVLAREDLLLSLGQLQHGLRGAFGFYPTYPFGNSWADVRIPRTDTYMDSMFSSTYGAGGKETLYDLSWHLNRELWDQFFISGVPDTWTQADLNNGRALPNSQYVPYGQPDIAELNAASGSSDAYVEAAANLMVNGSFNVNSTSEQAWRALLAASLKLPQDSEYADSGDNVEKIIPVPRFSRSQSQHGYEQGEFDNVMKTRTSGKMLNYLGNRGLAMMVDGSYSASAEEIVKELASRIVDEVRSRGPFLSLADFVNRSRTADETGIKGALQAAIDKMTAAQVNPDAWTSTGAPLKASDNPMSGYWDDDHFRGGPDDNAGYSAHFAACPKFLTQADLLSYLGPTLSARSDCFRIRAYGEALDPLTGAIVGRAWCEAVVQRFPEYMDPADEASTVPGDLVSTLNEKFGRRYKIVAFRWLNPSEI